MQIPQFNYEYVKEPRGFWNAMEKNRGRGAAPPKRSVDPVDPHRRNIAHYKLHFVQRHAAIKPFHHRWHVSEKPEGRTFLGLLEYRSKNLLTDFLL